MAYFCHESGRFFLLRSEDVRKSAKQCQPGASARAVSAQTCASVLVTGLRGRGGMEAAGGECLYFQVMLGHQG